MFPMPKFRFLITFEAEVEIPESELKERNLTDLEDAEDFFNSEYDSDLVEEYVPPFDPDKPEWSCTNHEWRAMQ